MGYEHTERKISEDSVEVSMGYNELDMKAKQVGSNKER